MDLLGINLAMSGAGILHSQDLSVLHLLIFKTRKKQIHIRLPKTKCWNYKIGIWKLKYDFEGTKWALKLYKNYKNECIMVNLNNHQLALTF